MADKKLNSLSFPGLSDRYIIPPGSVFVVYEFGTSAEIESAYQNSTPVFCSVAPSFGQTPVICRLVKRSSATLHYFAGLDEYGVMHFATCSSDTWTRSTRSISPEDATPQPLGTASAGTAEQYSRGDHVHAMPSAADVGAIAAPVSPSANDVLTYSNGAWGAAAPAKEIYLCTYGTTTNAQIDAAMNAGKACVVGNANILYLLSYRVSSNKHIFGAVTDEGQVAVAICNNDAWSVNVSSIPVGSSATPQALGTAAAGSSTNFSRADHVHAMPTAANVGAIAAPSSPSVGDFLVYTSNGWAAQSLSTWQGGSF